MIKSALMKVPAEEWAHKWIPNIMDQRRFIAKCNEDGYTEFDAETFYNLIDKYGFKSDGMSGYEYSSKRLESSRRPIKSSRYYIEYYTGGTDNGYVRYDNRPTIDLDNAMIFDSEQEANEWIDDHSNEWKATLKVVPYPDYDEIESSRRPIKSGVNLDVLECEKDIQKLTDYLYDIGRSDLVHEIDDDFDNDFPSDEKSYIRKVKTWCDWRESPLIDKLEEDEWQGYLDSINSSRKINSSQKGFENVAEGTKYDDYHIDTTGMGILDVENIIDAIESRGNQAVLTVQTSDGSTNHSQFSSKDWKEYKDSVNDAGNAITDVWITEVKGGSYVRNSRQIKSNYTYADEKHWNEPVHEEHHPNQLKLAKILCDTDSLRKRVIINKIKSELKSEGWDSKQIKHVGEELDFYSNMKRLDKVFWYVTYIGETGATEILRDYDKSIKSSLVRSARYIATDPETGEVLGSADTYDEAINEWGEDVIITDSKVGDRQEDTGLFSSLNKNDKQFIEGLITDSSIEDPDEEIENYIYECEELGELPEGTSREEFFDELINYFNELDSEVAEGQEKGGLFSSNKTVVRQGSNFKTLDETPAEHIMKNLDTYKGYTQYDMEELVLEPSGYTLYDSDNRNAVYKKDGAEDITLLFRNGELKDAKITSSRKPIKSGLDKENLIEKINEVEPDDYSDWSVEELQELAINLGISIESSRRPIKSGWERTDMASGPIWDNDKYRIIEKNDFDSEDKFYILRDKSNQRAKDIRFDTLAEAMDYVDFRANLNSSRQIKSAKNFVSVVPYTISFDNGKIAKKGTSFIVDYDRNESGDYVLGISVDGVGKTQLRFDSEDDAKQNGWIIESSRKPIKSSIYISDIIDDISDDCFEKIRQQIFRKYPNIDDDELTEKIDEYLEGWRYDSDSEVNNKKQAKQMVVDSWEDYIDLSDFDNSDSAVSTSSLDKLDIRAINFYAGEILKDVKNGKFPATMDGVREWVNLFNQREGVYFNPLYIKPIFEKLKRLLSPHVKALTEQEE